MHFCILLNRPLKANRDIASAEKSTLILKDNYVQQKCTLYPTDAEMKVSSSVTYCHLKLVDQPFN